MAFVVLGAGAIGAVVGARLHQAGHEVTLLARGAHLEALRARGLRVESPADAEILTVPAVADPSDVTWRDDQVVLLAVKSQHTQAALAGLAAAAPARTPIVCLQNGLTNEANRRHSPLETPEAADQPRQRHRGGVRPARSPRPFG